MVSIRCKRLVKAELEILDLRPMVVELGEVTIKENISREKHELLKMALSKSGLELMDDKKIVLFEKIKHAIIEMSHYLDEFHEKNLSDYLSKKLNRDYTCLAGLFSAVQGTTIENYVIAQKIERAKELLIHNELTVTDIAYKLNYSSVAHLSNQFKKVTGMTTSIFKSMNHKPLIAPIFE